MLDIKSKDFYRSEKYDLMIREGKIEWLAYHGGFGFPVLKIDAWIDDKWECIWRCTNDFDTFEESEKSAKSYVKFIDDEAVKIAEMIENGKNYKYITENIDEGHSGNTFGFAMKGGISLAKNQLNAEAVRKDHNEEFGSRDLKGVINPAVIEIGGEDGGI